MNDLSQLNKLIVLNLSETRISDAGLQQLKGLKNLKQVRMVGTNVTDAGAKQFDESRP
jgi:hypothetical protein